LFLRSIRFTTLPCGDKANRKSHYEIKHTRCALISSDVYRCFALITQKRTISFRYPVFKEQYCPLSRAEEHLNTTTIAKATGGSCQLF